MKRIAGHSYRLCYKTRFHTLYPYPCSSQHKGKHNEYHQLMLTCREAKRFVFTGGVNKMQSDPPRKMIILTDELSTECNIGYYR